MQRFKVEDRVVVFPRFVSLFRGGPATVIEVKLDPIRPIFNEYKIEFADGSTADVFEFQIRKITD